MREDPKLRLDWNVSSMIRICLKKNNGSKGGRSWTSCVGYTLEELMTHLERKFAPEMSWSNFGTYWELDHVIPKIWYRYSSPQDEEFRKCWALKNLQPLTKTQNSSKGSRYAGTPTDKILRKDLYDDTRVTNEDMRRLRPIQTDTGVFQEQIG
jgi:5-methylcytosine-specific restriction endonuclease McrA